MLKIGLNFGPARASGEGHPEPDSEGREKAAVLEEERQAPLETRSGFMHGTKQIRSFVTSAGLYYECPFKGAPKSGPGNARSHTRPNQHATGQARA